MMQSSSKLWVRWIQLLPAVLDPDRTTRRLVRMHPCKRWCQSCKIPASSKAWDWLIHLNASVHLNQRIMQLALSASASECNPSRRRHISIRVCEPWGWFYKNGSCRSPSLSTSMGHRGLHPCLRTWVSEISILVYEHGGRSLLSICSLPYRENWSLRFNISDKILWSSPEITPYAMLPQLGVVPRMARV